MVLRRLGTGMLASNCYILGDSGEGVVIDPGVRCSDIVNVLERENLVLKYIILTHAHLDHIVSMDELRLLTGAKVLVHESDTAALGDPVKNCASLFGLRTVFEKEDICLKDGE